MAQPRFGLKKRERERERERAFVCVCVCVCVCGEQTQDLKYIIKLLYISIHLHSRLQILIVILQPRCFHRHTSVNSHNQRQYKSILIQDVCGLVCPVLSVCFFAGPGWVWSLPLLPGAWASRSSQVE